MNKENENIKTNAVRFIEAYNQIDYALRVQHDFKRSMSFSDMIRRAVIVNYVVRKYEDDLIDYGRLRNAIIHRSNEQYIIAEPHSDVVEKIERISRLICTPPKAIDTVCSRDVLVVEYNVSIYNVIKLMSESTYSNIPVYKNGALIGVANGQRLINFIGSFILQGGDLDDFLKNTTIEKAVIAEDRVNYYDVASASVTVEDVLEMFQKNRKLLVVIVTKTGSMNETALGIITSSDVMEMNNILDNF